MSKGKNYKMFPFFCFQDFFTLSVLFHSRLKFKQEKILDKLNELVNKYDKRVALLKREKIRLSVDVKFLEIFMLVLHQELLVVQSYSERETKVNEQLSAKLKEKHGRLLKVGTRYKIIVA